MEDKKCLVQLDEILNYLNEEELTKIPKEIIESIKQNKDNEYIWKYDNSKPLNEQNIDRKVIAMLSYLNMEYLLNDEQKRFMEELHKSNDKKIQEELSKECEVEDIFNKKDIEIKNETANTELLVKTEPEKWYKKILLFFKSILKKS